MAPAPLAALQPGLGKPANASLANRLVPVAAGEVSISAAFAEAQVIPRLGSDFCHRAITAAHQT